MPALQRHDPGALPERIQRQGVRASAKQKITDFHVAARGGEVERRAAASIWHAGIGAQTEQRCRGRTAALQCGKM